jgi:LmbE family N-acetylglucosaminyl deacetylase
VELVRGSLLVISPHLDDAALGCGTLLANRPGSVVVSVFAGTGSDPDQQTDWDRSCGFRCAAEAMATRRDEDDGALSLLGASPCRLDFADDQYRNAGDPVDVEAIAMALRTALHNAGPHLGAFVLPPHLSEA